MAADQFCLLTPNVFFFSLPHEIECTYDHFNVNSACPSCSRNLKPNDFMQIAIANAPPVKELTKATFQTMFTKTSPTATDLTQQDMCHRLMKHYEDGKRATRFLMKQFMVHAKNTSQQTNHMGRAYQQLKHQFMQLQQSSQATIATQQRQLVEQEELLRKFRERYARDGAQRIPSSAHSTGSHSSRGSRGSHSDPQRPPLQAYILQQQVRGRENERAAAAALAQQQQQQRNIHGPDVDSVITPIVPPSSQRHLSSNRPPHAIPPSTPRLGQRQPHQHRGSGGGVLPQPPGASSVIFSQQRKRSHGSAMPDGGSMQRQQQTPPPGSSYTNASFSAANPYKFSTSRRSR
jgi:hypothetical protein